MSRADKLPRQRLVSRRRQFVANDVGCADATDSVVCAEALMEHMLLPRSTQAQGVFRRRGLHPKERVPYGRGVGQGET